MASPRTPKKPPVHIARVEDSNDLYRVTDGHDEMVTCPCCQKPLTLKAATRLLHNINELDIDIPAFKLIFEKIRITPPKKMEG